VGEKKYMPTQRQRRHGTGHLLDMPVFLQKVSIDYLSLAVIMTFLWRRQRKSRYQAVVADACINKHYISHIKG
jgi:hypothetical protein